MPRAGPGPMLPIVSEIVHTHLRKHTQSHTNPPSRECRDNPTFVGEPRTEDTVVLGDFIPFVLLLPLLLLLLATTLSLFPSGLLRDTRYH